MIKSVVWASMLDYPEHICSTLFFDGCNFNCEYCYNKTLSTLKEIDFEKEILPKLIKRKDVINHIILSGGECTISNDFQMIINSLYNNGFIIGLHTNGSQPDILLKNINKISYIGMDIKTDFANYSEVLKNKIDIEQIKKSIEIIRQSKINYEFRTTVYPRQITKKNCINIARMLKESEITQYFLQNYSSVEGIKQNPLTEEELKDIAKACNEIIPTVIKNI